MSNDFDIAPVIDWILWRLPRRRLFTRDEVVDMLLDLRNEATKKVQT